MRILDYQTAGGKNLIKEYLSALPKAERDIGYKIRHKIVQYGLAAFDELDTRQLRGELWEIKFSQNRIMYVIADKDNVYFLHACKKQKDKAEKFELDKTIRRAKETGFNMKNGGENMPFADVTDIVLAEEKAQIDKDYSDDPKVRLAIDQFEAECRLRKELAEARRGNNMSQEKLKELTGLTQQTISRIETNSEISPSLKILLRYVNAIGYELKLVKK